MLDEVWHYMLCLSGCGRDVPLLVCVVCRYCYVTGGSKIRDFRCCLCPPAYGRYQGCGVAKRCNGLLRPRGCCMSGWFFRHFTSLSSTIQGPHAQQIMYVIVQFVVGVLKWSCFLLGTDCESPRRRSTCVCLSKHLCLQGQVVCARHKEGEKGIHEALLCTGQCCYAWCKIVYMAACGVCLVAAFPLIAPTQQLSALSR